MIGLFTYQ